VRRGATGAGPPRGSAARRAGLTVVVAVSALMIGATLISAVSSGEAGDQAMVVTEIAADPGDLSGVEPDAAATEPESEAAGSAELMSTDAPTAASAFPGAWPVPADIALPPTAQAQSARFAIEPVAEIALLTAIRWSMLDSAYFAISQDGLVHRLPQDLSSVEMVMDLTDAVVEYQNLSERGLLGIAFDPTDGRMFLHYNDTAGHTNIRSYSMVDGRPDRSSEREVLFMEQPGPGHQGGTMRFDDAGHLYVAFGDGGGSRGRDAQDYSKLHGAIIRITPNRDGGGYTVPADNPFVGDPERRDEILHKGLRNPWQFTINPANGDMWIGDVGEDSFEELNYVPAGTTGLNFGWYYFEGNKDRGTGEVPPGVEFTAPVHEHSREIGVSIIGGEVYHGAQIPELRGAYLFADMSGPLFVYGNEGSARLASSGGGVITGFAETPERELLMTTLYRGLFRIVPA
jgi:glucose/arabinose dehydrogenase